MSGAWPNVQAFALQTKPTGVVGVSWEFNLFVPLHTEFFGKIQYPGVSQVVSQTRPGAVRPDDRAIDNDFFFLLLLSVYPALGHISPRVT